MPTQDGFTFNIALSVLNHLGRNLYRNFITILGEAISNSWDADANHVWITLDRINPKMLILDDGSGMTAGDFQKKFLRIGYSKRKEAGNLSSVRNRPYIGAKGIGKLALLSCAQKVSVVSKTDNSDLIGGTIDNAGLDRAITDELSPSEYSLMGLGEELLNMFPTDCNHGTALIFDELNEGIRNSEEQLRKLLALHFQFSIIDHDFEIIFNGIPIGVEDLQELTSETQFVWKTEGCPSSPLLDEIETVVVKRAVFTIMEGVTGFIASVNKPRYLNIRGLNERASIDLFVNGRLRERNLLNKAPSAQAPSEYVYGQLYFDSLDDGEGDPFTSSREGIKADTEEYREFIKKLQVALRKIYSEWDEYRIELRQPGDSENPSHSPRNRAAKDLASAIVGEYKDEFCEDTGRQERDSDSAPNEETHSTEDNRVVGWIDDLQEDAEYNFSAYADCFISENLLRRYANEKQIPLTTKFNSAANKYRSKESSNLEAADLTIGIRRDTKDLAYLDMDLLVQLADQNDNNLHTYGNQYKPIRDATMHTSLLTDEAKARLGQVFNNIKARVMTKIKGDS
jgi:hypothetical protein